MRRLKFLLLFTVALCLSGVAVAQIDVTIKGTIKGLEGHEVQLLSRQGKLIATGNTEGENYTIKANIEIGSGIYYILHIPFVGKFGDLTSQPNIFFLIDSPTIEVNGEVVRKIWHGETTPRSSIENRKIIGSRILQQVDSIQASSPYKEELNKALEVGNKYFELYNHTEGGMTEENLALLKKSSGVIDSLFTLQSEYFIDEVANNSKSIAYAALMNEWHRNSPIEIIERIYNSFDPSIKGVSALVELKANLDAKLGARPGSIAPEFTLAALDGSMVSLSQFRGKYVLIDFWASWCGPCIKEMPYVKQVYDKHNSSGKLQVIGVSTDSNEGKWRSKVAELGLDKKYLQLIDLGGKSVMKSYDFQGIPYLVVISPDGKILEINLRGQKLLDAMDKYLQ